MIVYGLHIQLDRDHEENKRVAMNEQFQTKFNTVRAATSGNTDRTQ